MKLCAYFNLCLTLGFVFWSGALYGSDSQSQRETASNRVEVDFSKRAQFEMQDSGLIDHSDVAFVIPTNMETTNDSVQVEKRILSHWGRSLGKASYIRDNKIVRSLKRTAASLRKATDFELKTPEPKVKAKTKPKSPVDLIKVPKKINHAFKLKVQALKLEAKLVYNGFCESSVTYKQRSNEVLIQANKVLTKNSRLGLSSQSLPDGSNTYLTYGYSW